MSDYDFEPRTAPSIFLKLKEKGDMVGIRIASPPYREPKVWKLDVKPPLDPEKVVALSEEQWMTLYRDPDYNITEAFHWVVIDRDSGTAKIFSGTSGIYKQIKKFAEMKEWGNPTTYDFQIERTEQPGPSYYQVTAMPNKDPLSQKEEEMVKAINLQEKLPAARKLSEVQVDYMSELDETIDSASAKKQAVAKDDIVIEDMGGEPINLDDIPF